MCLQVHKWKPESSLLPVICIVQLHCGTQWEIKKLIKFVCKSKKEKLQIHRPQERRIKPHSVATEEVNLWWLRNKIPQMKVIYYVINKIEIKTFTWTNEDLQNLTIVYNIFLTFTRPDRNGKQKTKRKIK